MPLLTQKAINQIEDYYYWTGHKQWYPFPETLRTILMDRYGPENPTQDWMEQNIYKGCNRQVGFNTLSQIRLNS